MISDILKKLIEEINICLNDPKFDVMYCVAYHERIGRFRDEAEWVRGVLDTSLGEIPLPNDHQDSKISARRKWIDWMMSDDESAFNLRIPYFSRSDLLKRGWSKGLIDRLLGKEDWTSPNPHGPFKAMLCWREDRVLEVEHTLAFREHRSRRRG
jgi:hypothetical protein